MSILSWNVWFDDKSGQKRYPKILSAIESMQVEIVHLQEVTPLFLKTIRRHSILQHYSLIKSLDTQHSYGQAFLTQVPILTWREFSLDSKYGRKALLALYPLGRNKASILINVHLESGLLESSARQAQVEEILESLLPRFKQLVSKRWPQLEIAGVLWGGDFNFGLTEFPRGIEKFTDVGRLFEDNSPTYHINMNPIANYTASLFEDSARLDRWFIRSNEIFDALSYEVLNQNKYGELSDHYPIKVILRF